MARYATILRDQIEEAGRSTSHVIVHLDWFKRRELLGLAVALTLWKLANAFRPGGSKSAPVAVWAQFHDRGKYDSSQAKLIGMLSAIKVPVLISVPTAPLVAYYTERCSAKIVQFSFPLNKTIDRIVANGGVAASRLPRDGKIVCLLAGQVFDAKGYDELERFLSASSDPRAKKDYWIELRAPSSTGLRSRNPLVEIVDLPSGQLPEQAYANSFLESDVVLMPYSANKYKYAVSGVFIDAVALGTIPLVRKETIMACELETFGLSELALDWEQDFSWDLVTSVARDASIRKRLDRMSAAYAKRHSVQSFAAVIAGIMQALGAPCIEDTGHSRPEIGERVLP